jgi:hypothetical protein
MPLASPCLALAFVLPPGTCTQYGVPKVKPAYLRGYLFQDSSLHRFARIAITPCGSIPELLAHSVGLPELLALWEVTLLGRFVTTGVSI